MERIRFQDVTKDFGHREILSGATFQITSGQKIGLIGPNGAGKTTILRLLTGEEPPTSGAITRQAGLRIGYVPQKVEADDGATVLEHVLEHQLAARATVAAAEEALASASRDDAVAAADAYEVARAAFDAAGGDAFEPRARAILDALGLAGREEQPVSALSGGEKNVMSLAAALVREPDLLLLDEPGNHLDFAGIAWLESFLAKFRGAVLLVSHNRYLLDRVATTIFELDAGRVSTYSGNYSTYRGQRLREKLNQRADYVVNQRRLAQLEEVVRRFEERARVSGDSAWGKRLRARRSQLEHEREHAVEKPQAEASGIRLAFTSAGSQADIALQARGYNKAFGDLVLLENADVEVRCGERVALIGPNGCGKTTLLRDIIAEGAWDHPHLRIGPSLTIGYCAQEQDVLDNDRTVLAELMATAEISRDRAFGILLQFLFRPDDFSKLVGDLSGGERNRLQLAKLVVTQPDLLILDEPTNHLDIPACEAIEDALADYKGTIVAVSHDRYFLDKIAGRIIELRDRKLVSFDGNFSEYWASRRPETRIETARVGTRRSSRERRPAAPAAPTRRGHSDAYAARIEEAEREASRLEQRVADAFSRGDLREGQRASKLLAAQQARVRELYERWEAEEMRRPR